MLPVSRLRPTRRRLGVTAWFVAFMAFVFLFGPLLDGWRPDRAAVGWIVPIVILGYLLAPVWQVAATTGRWISFPERAGKTAVTMAAGVATGIAIDALLTGGVGVVGVLQGVALIGGLYLFIMIMPRIATGQWK